MKQIFCIGVAGGSGSGKTTVVAKLQEACGAHIALLAHDAYYKDQSHLEMTERKKTNYDHPDSLETSLLCEHVKQLKAGRTVDMPLYDFVMHTRSNKTEHIEPKPILVVEGILTFDDPTLRSLFDLKIFVDTDADVRFIRRVDRDIRERGRTFESVVEQYLSTVRPMHLEFVEPSKRYADVIIPEGGLNAQAMDLLIDRVRTIATSTDAVGGAAPLVQ